MIVVVVTMAVGGNWARRLRSRSCSSSSAQRKREKGINRHAQSTASSQRPESAQEPIYTHTQRKHKCTHKYKHISKLINLITATKCNYLKRYAYINATYCN